MGPGPGLGVVRVGPTREDLGRTRGPSLEDLVGWDEGPLRQDVGVRSGDLSGRGDRVVGGVTHTLRDRWTDTNDDQEGDVLDGLGSRHGTGTSPVSRTPHPRQDDSATGTPDSRGKPVRPHDLPPGVEGRST